MFIVADDPNLSETWVPADSDNVGEPTETRATVPRMSDIRNAPTPEKVGRYAIEDVLGAGGYGCVYLAKDTELQRHVALKLPHVHMIDRAETVDRFLAEAQTVASLDHSGVVPIYDFGRWEDRCYVVYKFIDGETLYQRRTRAMLTIGEAVTLIRSIAKTLAYIHGSGIVHRDIKPGNLLLDESGNCFVTDFGLALRDFELDPEPGQMGTISYMSPEQARGESHLVDGRSDLFSLGVVMYELLTGQRPFSGQNWQATVVMLCYHDPKPPRQRVSAIPRELERICLKLLAKKPGDRYLTATDLVEDLDYFLETSTDQDESVALPPKLPLTDPSGSTQDLVGIIPRGLRSFGREDASFFHQLLPGPRDRDGMPDSVRFWKQKVESQDSDEAFRLGVIYGPSGSGKSSFVKAGLVPTLADRINVVSVEAVGGKTEERLRQRLHAQCPSTSGLGLKETLSKIRNQSDSSGTQTVLILIDQFEQWLHEWDETPDTELVVALRQCDGIRLRAVLLVRDDFWLAVSRFADVVGFELIPGRNLSMVDLFDRRHARKVLAEYGRGHARLPESLRELTKTQNAFLDAAIDGLAVGDRIVPIQLAAFSEIMKSRDWNTDSLRELGGVKGVGVRFLEESFTTVGAPANQRTHAQAAQQILQALLPNADTNIKGAMRSESELQQAAGYEGQRRLFEQVVKILDTDLRLITPADASSDSATAGDSDGEGQPRFYQLTHDFLVPAVRAWLEQHQSRTLQGRAALRLADRTEVWMARPDSRHLPSWLEWTSLALLTRRTQRTSSQQRMMSAATKRHSLSTIFAATLILLLAFFVRHGIRTVQANGQIEQLMTAESDDVLAIVNRLAEMQSWTQQKLFDRMHAQDQSDSEKLRAALAVYRQRPGDETAIQVLGTQLTSMKTDLLQPFVRVTEKTAPSTWKSVLWERLRADSTTVTAKCRALLLLAALDPPNASLKRWDSIGVNTAKVLMARIAEAPDDFNTIQQLIRPAESHVLPQLAELFENPDLPMAERKSSAALAISLLSQRPGDLTDLLLNSPDEMVPTMIETVAPIFPQVEKLLEETIDIAPTLRMDPEEQDRVANRQANAAVLLLSNDASQDVFHLLFHAAIPNTRTNLIGRLGILSLSPSVLRRQIVRSNDPGLQSALLMVLAERTTPMTAVQRDECIALASKQFAENESAEVHSAADWMLRRLGENETVESLRQMTMQTERDNSEWQETQFGTFVQFRDADEPFEICSTEVTMEQFLAYRPSHNYAEEKAPSQQCPAMLVSWEDAVKYCLWLTSGVGLAEEDQCYEKDESTGRYSLHSDFLSRRGFRLPTPYEWRLACLGDVATQHFFGHRHDLNLRYSLNYSNSTPPDRPVIPVGSLRPGLFGLFDMTGNVSEWCSMRSGGGSGRRQSQRPIRGGSVASSADSLVRLTQQGKVAEDTQYHSIGFRLARSIIGDE